MNPEEKAFLEAILKEPEEDTPRLAYADWLDEHEHSMYARAIRAHIAHARAKNPQKTSARSAAAWRKIAKKSMEGKDGFICRAVLMGQFCDFRFTERGRLEPFLVYFFERGICTSIKCTWDFWRNHWEKLRATPALPIRNVKLTNRPQAGYSFMGSKFYMTFDEYAEEMWPGVKFELPRREAVPR